MFDKIDDQVDRWSPALNSRRSAWLPARRRESRRRAIASFRRALGVREAREFLPDFTGPKLAVWALIEGEQADV
jgi:hypothetical protein